jgi:hypothetical protein
LNQIQIELEDLIDLMVNDVNRGTIEAFRMLHVWNSSVESSIMAHCGDGGPLWVEPMKVVPESPLLEEPQTAEVVGDELKAPKISLPGTPTVGVFCTSKLWGVQDHVF